MKVFELLVDRLVEDAQSRIVKYVDLDVDVDNAVSECEFSDLTDSDFALDYDYTVILTESIKEKLDEYISQKEVIYYSRAMEYLSDHDASLQQSLELAEEYGYKPSDLSSETLATLLLQYNLRNELEDYDIDAELGEILSDYDEISNSCASLRNVIDEYMLDEDELDEEYKDIIDEMNLSEVDLEKIPCMITDFTNLIEEKAKENEDEED